jgi:uridylate kinase
VAKKAAVAAAPRRVLLKLSGEGLCREGGRGYDPEAVRSLAQEIAGLPLSGIQTAIVVGGGNLVRGRDLPGDVVERTAADAAGMLATISNSVVLAAALRTAGARSRILTAIPMPDVADPFTADRARSALEDGEVLVLGGGTGRPYFTTDTAAALRALEVGAELLLKATTVDGVYDRDPRKGKGAKRFDTLSFDEVLERRLGVMDQTAFTLCRDNALPIVVFSLRPMGNLSRAAAGQPVGTRIG